MRKKRGVLPLREFIEMGETFWPGSNRRVYPDEEESGVRRRIVTVVSEADARAKGPRIKHRGKKNHRHVSKTSRGVAGVFYH
jgi:hypothetical protein